MINNPWKGPIARITRTNFSFPSQRRRRGRFLEPRHFPPRLQRSSLPLEAVCIKKTNKTKKKDDTKYRCVRGAQRSGGKETIGRREGKKRKKKKGRNNETCFQLANKFPLSSILPTLLSSRTRNYASEWNEAATFPKVNFFPSPPPPPPPPPPTVVYTRAEWPFTVVRNRNDSRDSWKPTLSFVVRIEKCDSPVCN